MSEALLPDVFEEPLVEGGIVVGLGPGIVTGVGIDGKLDVLVADVFERFPCMNFMYMKTNMSAFIATSINCMGMVARVMLR